MINNITLVGRLGKDPELRYFESGKVKASFSIAITRPTKEKETDWFDVECWGKTAETLGEFCKKGHLIGITGGIRQEKWTDDNGNKRSKVIVSASNIHLMQPKAGNGENADDNFDFG